ERDVNPVRQADEQRLCRPPAESRISARIGHFDSRRASLFRFHGLRPAAPHDMTVHQHHIAFVKMPFLINTTPPVVTLVPSGMAMSEVMGAVGFPSCIIII